MDLCVQIAEHAYDLNVIREDLARRKTLNSSTIALSQPPQCQQYSRTTEQPRPPIQNNGATLNVYNQTEPSYTPESQGYYQVPTTQNLRYRPSSSRQE